jgi:hypothetical protein
MLKKWVFLILIGFAFSFASCITSPYPEEGRLALQIGESQVFEATLSLPGEKGRWFLDGVQVAEEAKSYNYEGAGRPGTAHVLSLRSTYLGLKDDHSWIIDLEDPGVSKTIGPEGGEIEIADYENPNRKTIVQIPPGALTEARTLTAKIVKNPGNMEDQPVGACVSLEPDGVAFLKPIEVIFSYDDGDQDGFLNGYGVSEENLAVSYYNEAAAAWEKLALESQDTILNQLQVATPHFSTYALNIPTWQNLYGGSGSEEIHSVSKTADGGYIVAGASTSTDIEGQVNGGWMDFYIVKLDSSGVIDWQRQIGGEEGDELFSIQQTANGGYIVSGSRERNTGEGGYYVACLDAFGLLVWEKWYTNKGDDCANMVKPTADGGFIIAGTASSSILGTTYHGGDGDYYIIKTDADGDIEWHAMYGGSGAEEMRAIQPVSDGGYIVVGYSESEDIPGITGERAFHIFKLDRRGRVLWNKKIGGNGDDNAWFVVETSDKGFVVVGDSQSTDIPDFKGQVDILLMKIDGDGNSLWHKLYGGNGCDGASSVAETAEGGFIISGISDSTDIPGTSPRGDFDAYVIKTGPDGTLEWQKLFGGSGRESSDNCTDCVHQTREGGYMIVSDSLSQDIPGTLNKGERDFYVLKIDANGDL